MRLRGSDESECGTEIVTVVARVNVSERVGVRFQGVGEGFGWK